MSTLIKDKPFGFWCFTAYCMLLAFGMLFIALLNSCSFVEPSGDTITYIYSVNTTAHAETHEDSGVDEISVAGLLGLLANDQHILDVEAVAAIEAEGDLDLPDDTYGRYIIRKITNSRISLYGGGKTAGNGAVLQLAGKDAGGETGRFILHTPDSLGTGSRQRLVISGMVDIATIGWSLATHNGIVLGNFLDAVSNFISFTEMGAPEAGAANTARIYAVLGGDTLTDMCAVFQDGTVDIFAQETTELDAPIFTQPSGSVVRIIMKKPHAGLVQFVAMFGNEEYFVIKEIEYHDYDKIMANVGCKGDLPDDWLVETAAERAERNLILIASGNKTGEK